MSNPFQSYTSEIVTRLMAMDREKSRAWFAAIHAYVERMSGQKVATIHEYIVKPAGPDDAKPDGRPVVLHAVVDALRTNEIERLSETSAA